MHLVRLLHSGIHALQTGGILVDASEHRSELLAIRNGEFTFEEVERIAIDLNAKFAEVFDRSTLPDQPDFAAIDQFLVEARRSAVD